MDIFFFNARSNVPLIHQMKEEGGKAVSFGSINCDLFSIKSDQKPSLLQKEYIEIKLKPHADVISNGESLKSPIFTDIGRR